MRLLTAASEVRLWSVDTVNNVNQLRPIKSWNPFLPNDSVGACAWSNDNAVLAITGRATSECRIAAFRTDSETVRSDALIEEHPLTIALNSSGRYAVCGAESGKLFIVDLKTGRTKRKFDVAAANQSTLQAVTCAQFNAKDTLVVSGTQNGSLHVFNVQTQLAYAPLVLSRRAVNNRLSSNQTSSNSAPAVHSFAFSPHNAALVAAAYEDGTIGFWNVSERSQVGFIERVHATVSTGVCFSPVSDQLVVSAGLDGRFALHDVNTHRRIALVRAGREGGSLTSIDMSADGYTIACSTQFGSVHFYDIRSLGTACNKDSMTGDADCFTAEAICSVPKAHSAPVRHCRFERADANDIAANLFVSHTQTVCQSNDSLVQPNFTGDTSERDRGSLGFGVSIEQPDSTLDQRGDLNNNKPLVEKEAFGDAADANFTERPCKTSRITFEEKTSFTCSNVGEAELSLPPLDAISPLRTAEQLEAMHSRSASLTLTGRSRVSDLGGSINEEGEQCLRDLYREFRFAGETLPLSKLPEPIQTPTGIYDRSRSRSTPIVDAPTSASASASASIAALLRQASSHHEASGNAATPSGLAAASTSTSASASAPIADGRVLVDVDTLARVLGRLETLEERLEATEERLRSETRNAHLDFILLIREQNERIDEALAHLRVQNEFREENSRLKREIVELRKMY